MSTKHVKRLPLLAFGIFGAVLAAGQPTPLAAQTPPYPWCSVGEEVHCDFDTLQQCEETVDYHGFCEQNPDLPAQSTAPGPAHRNTAGRRTSPQ